MAEPLRKTDLIRLLTGRTMSPEQIVALVRRNCLSFTPTARDRENLIAVGADSTLLGHIEACTRARAAASAPPKRPAAPVATVRRPSRTPPMRFGTTRPAVAPSGPAVTTAGGETPKVPTGVAVSDAAPSAAAPSGLARRLAPERTGFVLGMGQRGRVGESAQLPVVFEVRDSVGAGMADVPVSLTVVNGRLVGAQTATDSLGQVRAQVIFGERAGVPTVVSGSVSRLVRQATLYPAAGLPAQLVVSLGGNAVAGQLVVLPGRPTELRIFCRDAYGNPLPLVGLRAMVGDDHVVHVSDVASDSIGGSVTVTAGRGGATNLVIQGSGLRADFSALVRP